MAIDTFNKIAKFIVANGERTTVDNNSSVFDLSELSLVVENRNGKAHPSALTFTAFGLDWTRAASGDLQILDDSTDEVESFVVDDASYKEQIESYLAWRLASLEALSI